MIDKLLGAQDRGRRDASPLCREFDADLANAYVERRLTTGETTRYEAHLAACSPCRKTVVALTRLARAEAEPARPDVAVVGRAAGASPARRWLGALTAPQWAMAAAAAVVLAVALPLVLSSRAGRNDQAPSVNESSASQPAASTLAGGPEQKSSTDNAAAPARAAGRENATDRAASPSEKPAVVAQAKKEAPAEALAASGNQNGGAPAGAPPAEPKAADQVLAKSDSPAPPAGAAAAPPPPAPQTEEKESRQAVDNKDAAKPTATQPGRGEGAERAKADSDTQTVAIAPPPVRTLRRGDPPKTKRSNRVAGPAFSAFSGSSGEAARAPERKVGDHLFSLRGETWTDNDYDAGKDLPVVTIIRDSEVYRDLLAKEEKIKPFLTGFPADARVLFVFKGTVYNLIPQKGDK